MSRYPLAQFELGHRSPLSCEATASACFIVSLAADNGQVSLVMRQRGTDNEYITIKADTAVEIILEGEQLFFSKKYDAVTMKEDKLDFFYGGLQYGSYDEHTGRYKSVEFLARFNRGGKIGTRHGFNINVDLLQYIGGVPHWIGLTIDPDIINPPPGNN